MPSNNTGLDYVKLLLKGFVFDPTKHWTEYPCMLWERKTDERGYGRFKRNWKSIRAHQVAYEIVRGTVPSGLELDHLCRTPACFCPAHLEAVTHQENIRRSPIMYEESNTRFRQNGNRICRQCHRDQEKIRQAKRRAGRAASPQVHFDPSSS